MADLLLSAEWGEGPAPQMCLFPIDQKRDPKWPVHIGRLCMENTQSKVGQILTFVPKAEELTIYRQNPHLQQRIQIILIMS